MDDLEIALDRARTPGTLHHPIGPDAQVLAMVLWEATGRSLSTYMEKKLWSRLGAEAYALWLADSRGMELAFCGPNAVLRDYARFGLLFLNGGKNFRGQQILPARWVSASVTATPPQNTPGTGRPGAPPPQGYG